MAGLDRKWVSQKRDALRTDCRHFMGQFRGLRSVHHGEKSHRSPLVDDGSPAVRRRVLLILSFFHGDKIFAIVKNRKDTLSLLFFSLFGALIVQLTFLVTIEKSNAATATVLQFLSPTIIVTWFALARKAKPTLAVTAAIATSLIGTLLLVTHGNMTSLSISSEALVWGIASAFSPRSIPPIRRNLSPATARCRLSAGVCFSPD
jgi:hypothetical protein